MTFYEFIKLITSLSGGRNKDGKRELSAVIVEVGFTIRLCISWQMLEQRTSRVGIIRHY